MSIEDKYFEWKKAKAEAVLKRKETIRAAHIKFMEERDIIGNKFTADLNKIKKEYDDVRNSAEEIFKSEMKHIEEEYDA